MFTYKFTIYVLLAKCLFPNFRRSRDFISISVKSILPVPRSSCSKGLTSIFLITVYSSFVFSGPVVIVYDF